MAAWKLQTEQRDSIRLIAWISMAWEGQQQEDVQDLQGLLRADARAALQTAAKGQTISLQS